MTALKRREKSSKDGGKQTKPTEILSFLSLLLSRFLPFPINLSMFCNLDLAWNPVAELLGFFCLLKWQRLRNWSLCSRTGFPVKLTMWFEDDLMLIWKNAMLLYYWECKKWRKKSRKLTVSDCARRSSKSCWYFKVGVLPLDWISFFKAWANSSFRLRAVVLIPYNKKIITF